MVMDKREELAERLQSSLRKIMHCFKSTFRNELAQYGVTLPQFHLLKTVAQVGHANVKDISDRMMTSSPTASRMIDSLCRKELLEKRRDESDQRVTLLVLTKKGKNLMARIGAAQRELLMEVIGDRNMEELENTVNQLEEIADHWLISIKGPTDKDSNE
ncbi:MAG: MarR family transcriptional regulator [Actinobacteria bacterium]|nr:MarR family transcriptional regulator [Actinomycetota bacterium]